MAYKRPPIVEAVIDLGFGHELRTSELERAHKKLSRQYPAISERVDINVTIEGARATPQMVLGGYQMHAASGLDLIILQKKNLATSRLAPYQNWEALLDTAKKNHDTLVSAVGRQSIKRVSARYVNRLDIPIARLQEAGIGDFLVTGALMPKDAIKDLGAFSMQASFRERETGLLANIKVSTTSPALLAHSSYIIDIDVQMLEDIPLRPEEMWSAANSLRKAKNNLFEASITERARDLFT